MSGRSVKSRPATVTPARERAHPEAASGSPEPTKGKCPKAIAERQGPLARVHDETGPQASTHPIAQVGQPIAQVGQPGEVSRADTGARLDLDAHPHWAPLVPGTLRATWVRGGTG